MSRYIGNTANAQIAQQTQASAGGVYTLKDQLVYNTREQWPVGRDPYFNYTTLLLQGDVPYTRGRSAMTLPLTYNSDASTNNFLITPNGDVGPRPFSPYFGDNYSVYFDGTGLILPSSAALNAGTGNFTIEAWVYPISGGYLTGTTTGVLLFMPSSNDGLIRLGRENVAFDVSISAGLAKNKWQHVAISRSGTTVYVFLDGVLAGTGQSNQSYTLSGAYIGMGGTNYVGYVSNLRFIVGTALYTSSFTPPTNPLTAVPGTALLICQSNRFIDNSSNNFALTRSGTPRITDSSPFVSTDFTTGAGYFNGSSYLTAPASNIFDFAAGQAFTFECWFYCTTTGSQVITQGGANTFSLDVTPSPAGINYGKSGVANIISIAPSNFTANAWMHIVICRNTSNQSRIWLNGISVGSSSSDNYAFNNAVQYIGSTSNPGAYLNGYISGLRVLKGTALYDPTSSSNIIVPTVPPTPITNTVLCTLLTRAPSQNINFIDSSPNEFIVTKNGNTTQGTFSPFSPSGWSNYFGSSNYLSGSGQLLGIGSNDFTVEGWVFIPGPNGANSHMIFSNTTTSSTPYGIYFGINSSGAPQAAEAWGLNVINSTGLTYTWGTWAHVAVCRSGNTARLFLNGQPSTNTGTFNQSYTSTQFVIGRTWTTDSTYSNYMIGNIFNLRVISGQALYSGVFTPPTTVLTTTSVGSTGAGAATSLTGTVMLLTCQDNRFRDNSTYNRALTTNGSPSVQPFSPFAPTSAVSPLVTGGSAYFDGSDDIRMAANTYHGLGSQDFSIEAWVYLMGTSAGSFFTDQWTNGTTTTSIIATVGSGAANFDVYIGSTLYTLTSVSPTQYSWVHVVLARTGGTLSVFQNGIRTHTRSDLGSGSVNNAGTGTRAYPSIGESFTGYMSGHRFIIGSNAYNATLSTIPVPTAPPTVVVGTKHLFNFTNAAAVDATGRNVIETVGTTQLSTRVTKFAGTASGYFDATAAYQIIPNTAGLISLPGDFTLELWAYRLDAANNTYFCVFGNQAAGNNGFLFWVNGASSNAIRFYSNGAFVMSGANNTIPLNQWTHIALVRSGTATNNMRCYIDGVEDTTARATNTTAFVGVSGNGLAIGTEYSGSFSGTRAAFYYSNYRLTKYARYTANFNTNLPTAPFPRG